MEITGHDTILACFRVRPNHIRAFVDGLATEWPNLLASNSAAEDAGYRPWRSGGVPVDEPDGELYLVRDQPMAALQDAEGDAETLEGASPVAVYYRRAPAEIDLRINGSTGGRAASSDASRSS